jgi:hypothetical protein
MRTDLATHRLRTLAIAATGTAAMMLTGIGALPGSAAGASTMPSAVGNEAVQSLVVSPAYSTTHFVAALTIASVCSQNCTHVWVTHDGGFSWTHAAANGLTSALNLTDAVGPGNHDILYAGGGSQGVLRSDDSGEHWTSAGGNGTPTPAPDYTTSGVVVVAGTTDYLIEPGGDHQVSGSGGSLYDGYFTYAGTAGGQSATILLAAQDHAGNGLVERCSASYSCNSPAALPGTQRFSGVAVLVPSPSFASDGTVFAQTQTGTLKSSDGARSFTPLTIVPGTTSTPMVALAPGYRDSGPNRTVYAAVLHMVPASTTSTPPPYGTTGGIYVSHDGGSTWSSFTGPGYFDAGAVAVAVAPDGRIFGGYQRGGAHAGLLCSDDGGASWKTSCGTAAAHSSGQAAPSGHVAPGTSATPCAGVGCPVAAGSASAAASPSASGQGDPLALAGTGSASGTPGHSGRSGALIAVIVVLAAGFVAGGVMLGRRRLRAAR